MSIETYAININKVEQSKAYNKAKNQLEVLYQTYDNPADRVALLLDKTKPLLSHIDSSLLSEEQAQVIYDGIEACAAINNQEEFIASLLNVLKPLINLEIDNFSKVEAAKIEAINEFYGWDKLNQLLSYGKSGPVVHLHVPAGESVFNKRDQYYEGLAKLAQIVEKDPEIEWVEQASPIVAEHPGLFTRDNFIISDVTEEFKKRYFPGESKEIKKASLSREEFLKRFLPKQV